MRTNDLFWKHKGVQIESFVPFDGSFPVPKKNGSGKCTANNDNVTKAAEKVYCTGKNTDTIGKQDALGSHVDATGKQRRTHSGLVPKQNDDDDAYDFELQLQRLIKPKAVDSRIDLNALKNQPSDLIDWVELQKARAAQGRLKYSHARRLAELGVTWVEADDHWNRQYGKLLQNFELIYGAAEQSSSDPCIKGEFDIEDWLKVQIIFSAKNALAGGRNTKLNELSKKIIANTSSKRNHANTERSIDANTKAKTSDASASASYPAGVEWCWEPATWGNNSPARVTQSQSIVVKKGKDEREDGSGKMGSCRDLSKVDTGSRRFLEDLLCKEVLPPSILPPHEETTGACIPNQNTRPPTKKRKMEGRPLTRTDKEEGCFANDESKDKSKQPPVHKNKVVTKWRLGRKNRLRRMRPKHPNFYPFKSCT